VLVGLNALLIRPGMTGIGSHASNLVETLALAEEPEAYMLHRPDVTLPKREGLYPVPVIVTDSHFEQRELPNILGRLEVDLYHSPLPSCPVYRPCPAIVTVHDVIPLARPDLTSRSFAEYFQAVAELCIPSAELVITVSEFSRQDILRFLGVAAEKIRVVHQPAARRFCLPVSEKDMARVRVQYRLPARFVLYVGSLEPRKNTDGLLEALTALPKVQLVLVGRVQEDYDVEGSIARLGLAGRVRRLSYVRGEDLPALYALADVFVFPSLYEGFGLPVLEAMACGCPVVCSSATSLPEVGGKAVLYADPSSPQELATQIGRLLDSGELRDTLGERGRHRAAEFSHQRYATELLGIYQEFVS